MGSFHINVGNMMGEFNQHIAAVSCSLNVSRLGGVKMGFWLTGKLGRAWVGTWHGAWMVVVVVWIVSWGWDNCMCILPGLVMLGFGH